MKASLNLIITEISEAELRTLLNALNGAAPSVTVTSGSPEWAAPITSAPVTPTEAPAEVAPPTPPKNKGGRPRKSAAVTEMRDVSDEAEEAAPADAPKITGNALKQAISAAVKTKGIDVVRRVVGGFQNAQGVPATKLSDLQEKDFAAVVAALEAADDSEVA